jgi:hypothetical protein
MPGALPLLLVAIITPTGTWHVGAPGAPTQTRPLVAGGHRFAVGTGQATQRSIVVRGQHSRGAMPAASPQEVSVRRLVELRTVATATSGPDPSAPPLAVRVRGPPGTSAWVRRSA